MSFLHLSPGLVALGAAVLLGLAFLLQRLKVRHREVLVPTTLFWREAIERSEARKLTERFRHPLAYLLVALILLLLWLALAGPKPADARGTHYLLLVDGGAGMARGIAGEPDATLLDRALERAGELAADLPGDRRAVVLAGTPSLTLLAPGEPTGLLTDRAAELAAAAAPSRLAADLLDLVEARRTSAGLGFGAGEELEVLVFGSPDLPVAVPAALASSLSISAIDLDVEASANDGILGLGLAPAASGAWDRVDLILSATGGEPTVTVGGQARELQTDVQASPLPLDHRHWRVSDLLADGSTVRVTLPGDDASSLDDAAELTLPIRDRLGVYLDPALPGPEGALLAAVVAADPGLDAVAADAADVALLFAPPGPAPSGPAADRPALLLTESPEGSAPALVARRAGADGDPAHRRPAFGPTFEALALGRVGTDLTAGERKGAGALTEPAPAPTLAEETSPGPPRLTLDLRLLSAPYDLAEGRGLPLYLGLGLRWLAGTGELVPYAAAGRDLVTSARDELGLAPRPRRAGSFGPLHAGGETLTAALLASPTAGGLTPLSPADTDRLPTGGDPDRGAPFLVLALLLLGLEWHLFRTRRMP